VDGSKVGGTAAEGAGERDAMIKRRSRTSQVVPRGGRRVLKGEKNGDGGFESVSADEWRNSAKRRGQAPPRSARGAVKARGWA